MSPIRPRLLQVRLGGTVLCLGVAGTGLWGGCVNQAKEVQTYRHVLDDPGPRPQPLEPNETLTLTRALALANADNEQLASQGETYLQALIAKERAFAAFLPMVNFEPTFTAEQAPKGNAFPNSPGAPATNAAAAAATQGGFVQHGDVLERLEAPVDASLSFSYQSIPAYGVARTLVQQQRQVLLDARATLLVNVVQTYFQVLISTQQVDVLEHSLTLQKARVADLEERYRVRLALVLDVEQARSDEAATQVLLSQAANTLRNGRRTLAVLIGAARVDGTLVAETLVSSAPAPVDEYVARAMADRQDLLAAQAAVRAARSAVQATVADYYPSLSLNVAGFLYRENYADASKWNGILAANLPLFSAGTIHADVRTAWSRLRQAALAESYLRREIIQSVRTDYDNWVTSGAVQADLSREVQASAEAYRQSVQLEKNGLAIPLDVLTAQTTFLNSQLQYAQEAYSRTVDQLALIRAVGDLDVRTPERLRWEVAAPLPVTP